MAGNVSTHPAMKNLARLAALAAACPALVCAQASAPAPTTMTAKTTETPLVSAAYEWTKLAVTPTPTGERRAVFEGPTASLDKLHCHSSTLNVGMTSGEPRKHLQEEVIIIKEGLVEASVDGKLTTVGPGSILFMAANAVTRLRNAGDTPCTYIVVYYYTARTPKG